MFDQKTGQGNRIAVPEVCKNHYGKTSEHFVYKTKHDLPASSAEIDLLTAAVLEVVYDTGLEPCEIGLYLGNDLQPPAREVFDKIHNSGHPGLSILACEWAALHEDSHFNGSAFVSRVLHVGPSPYILSLAHTEKGRSCGVRVKSSNVILEKGDTFVFDPSTPHTAMPVSLSSEALLVLLQWEEKDSSSDDRQDLLKKYPVLPPDTEELSAYGSHLLAR
jgi:hypothetical protein